MSWPCNIYVKLLLIRLSYTPNAWPTATAPTCHEESQALTVQPYLRALRLRLSSALRRTMSGWSMSLPCTHAHAHAHACLAECEWPMRWHSCSCCTHSLPWSNTGVMTKQVKYWSHESNTGVITKQVKYWSHD